MLDAKNPKSWGNGINAGGQVAGASRAGRATASNPNGTPHAFRSHGTGTGIVDLGSLDSNLDSDGYGINDNGQVVGRTAYYAGTTKVRTWFVCTDKMLQFWTLIDNLDALVNQGILAPGTTSNDIEVYGNGICINDNDVVLPSGKKSSHGQICGTIAVNGARIQFILTRNN